MQQWIRCPRCGANNAPGQRFCNACGNPLASGCPNCGTPLNPGSTFCPRCGMAAGGAPPQQAGYYPPPQQPGYPPQQPGYPPQPGYPQQPGYPPQQPGYPPPVPPPGYPPAGYPPQPGYPPPTPGYPPPAPGYPPQPGYPPGAYPPPQPGYPPPPPGYPPPYGHGGQPSSGGGGKGMLIFLLVILIAGLGGFGYWAYSQGYLKGLPLPKFGSENSTKTSSNAVPPQITEISVDTPALDGFIVRWTTNLMASSQVEYGPKGSYTSKTDVVTDNNTGKILYPFAHAVIVKGLTAGTDYQYRVISTTPDGGTATSDDNYATTAANITP